MDNTPPDARTERQAAFDKVNKDLRTVSDNIDKQSELLSKTIKELERRLADLVAHVHALSSGQAPAQKEHDKSDPTE